MRASNHGELGLIVLSSCKELGRLVDERILQLRAEEDDDKSYLVPIEEVRFSNGEGKIKLLDSVRGKDIYILCDVGNYSCEYTMFGRNHCMGPDEHFQDIKRVLSAIGGKADRVTVIILTFDVHDPTIHNAIPGTSFENIFPTYSMLKCFIANEGANIKKDNMTVISPDTGAMDRAIYYANTLGVDVGMFYKRRDHTVVVNGKNPIVQHEYIGGPLENKKVLIVDDMIASGESIIDIIGEISKQNVDETFVACTFAFFTEGVAKFDKLYEEGRLTKIYTTNLSYIPQEIRERPWLCVVDLSKYVAKIVNTLNHDDSISSLLDATHRIRKLLKKSDMI